MKRSNLMRYSALSLLLVLLLSLFSCGTLPFDELPQPGGSYPFYGVGTTSWSSGGTSAESTVEIAPPVAEGSTFEVHFIDVGQADAALVLCDGRSMLIDGGNRADGDLIHTYLDRLGLTYLDYVVGTHAHEDHIGGLAAALTYAQAGEVWCPVKSYDSQAFKNFAAKAAARDKELICPAADSTVMLGSATVTVLAPRGKYTNVNDTSIVLRIVYGQTSFLFTGDAERAAETDIREAGVNLSATVLKVGHHGAETSTTYPFLREIMPQYAIISVGKGNTYGHPTDAVLSRLRDAGVTVYRTDEKGDIICTSDGVSVKFQMG